MVWPETIVPPVVASVSLSPVSSVVRPDVVPVDPVASVVDVVAVTLTDTPVVSTVVDSVPESVPVSVVGVVLSADVLSSPQPGVVSAAASASADAMLHLRLSTSNKANASTPTGFHNVDGVGRAMEKPSAEIRGVPVHG